MDRSCCHPSEMNSACPIGADFQVVTTDVYTKYFTRCQGDLCNDGPGDNSDDADNGGKYLFLHNRLPLTRNTFTLALNRYYCLL